MYNKMFFLIASLVILPSFVAAGNITGKFLFKKRPPAAALIYLPGDTSYSAAAVIDQQHTRFIQRMVVGKKGSQVQFKNSDSRNHNIFADGKDQNVKFDIGLAPPGSTYSQPITWDEGTMVRISCIIHPRMRAWVASLSSKFHHTITFDKKQKEVSFSMKGVPEKLKTLKVWLAGYDPIEVILISGESKTIELKRRKIVRGTLTLTRT